MKLFYLPNSCSFVPQVALYWTKEKFDLQLVNHELIKSPAYLEKNPAGQVPLLEDKGFYLSQNVAILHYLHQKFPQAKILGNGEITNTAKATQWLAFCNADLHPKFGRLFVPQIFTSQPSAQEELKTKAKEQIISLYQQANEQIQKHKFLSGEKTIADVYLYVTMNWCQFLDVDLKKFDALMNHYQIIDQDEGVIATKKDQTA